MSTPILNFIEKYFCVSKTIFSGDKPHPKQKICLPRQRSSISFLFWDLKEKAERFLSNGFPKGVPLAHLLSQESVVCYTLPSPAAKFGVIAVR